MKILWLNTNLGVLDFEYALFNFTIKDYCKKNNIHIDEYAIATKKVFFKDEIYMLNDIYRNITDEYDYFIVPLHNFRAVDNLAWHIEPNLLLCPVVYLLTGDESYDELINFNRNNERTIFVCFNEKQLKFVKENKSQSKAILMPPLLNTKNFYTDSEYDTDSIDVAMIGSYTESRGEIAELLIENDIDLFIVGNGWDKFKERTGYEKVFSKKNLDFHNSVLNRAKCCVIDSEYIKPLHFESIACGSMPIFRSNKQIEKYFGEHIKISYKDKKTVVSTVKSYLSNKDSYEKDFASLKQFVIDNYNEDAFYSSLLNKLQEK